MPARQDLRKEACVARIHVLGDTLINRIAAGEVVERPASVVKELVENSLDAGATMIEVRLEGGGKRRIEIRDDGCGMDRDDALLAVERHATSKLAAAEDLDTIATLGFRGEALASIAAVSELTLQTSDGGERGTEVEVRGGRIAAVRERGLPRGTTVRIDRLFGNTPARRKFLRGDSTELSHCVRWLTRYALIHPERRFLVEHGTRKVLEAAATTGLEQRVAQIFGREFAEKLLPFELREGSAVARGFAGRPVDALPRRTAQHFFVNNRAVYDRVLAHGVSAAYGNTMPPGRHPAVFLFLDIPPGAVDVNVHPQKTEVRFRESSSVHDLVLRAVRSSLSGTEAVPALGELRPGILPRAAEVREGVSQYVAHPPGPTAPLVDSMQEADDETRHRRAVPLAQFRDSYIVAEDEQGLLLVDQHAAHERVLYEDYLADAERNRVETQRLMFPLTVEVAPEERAGLEEEAEELRRLGFSVEPFGGDAIRIDGIPAIAAGSDPESLLREILGEAARAQAVASDVPQIRRRLVTTAACHAAIKVNYRLTMESMQGLLDRLYGTQNPTTCPHGRPAIFRLSLEEIERAFRRR